MPHVDLTLRHRRSYASDGVVRWQPQGGSCSVDPPDDQKINGRPTPLTAGPTRMSCANGRARRRWRSFPIRHRSTCSWCASCCRAPILIRPTRFRSERRSRLRSRLRSMSARVCCRLWVTLRFEAAPGLHEVLGGGVGAGGAEGGGVGVGAVGAGLGSSPLAQAPASTASSTIDRSPTRITDTLLAQDRRNGRAWPGL